jgi:hypothetical protein
VEIPCIGVTPGGYPKESSVCKGGILKKNFTGGITKPTYFAGGYQLFNPTYNILEYYFIMDNLHIVNLSNHILLILLLVASSLFVDSNSLFLKLLYQSLNYVYKPLDIFNNCQRKTMKGIIRPI